jgi:1-acyl-sn-glycerol-3-phosphate acyltransferase
MTPRGKSSTPAAVQLYRLILLTLHLLAGVLTVALLFPFFGTARRQLAIRRWSERTLGFLNVERRVRGKPPAEHGRPAVLVANHVSWLDIYVIHAVWQVRFIAKSEVRRWPVIGWLSARTGTLFIERAKRRHAAQINRAIHAAFQAGDAIGVFPEGTTTFGDEIGRFHASLLQPAVDEHALVYPVALRYLDPEGKLNRNAAYVGDTSLLESMRTILAEPALVAEIIFLPPIDAEGRSRRDLARETRAAIAAALNLPVSDSAPGISGDPRAGPPTGTGPTDNPSPAPADSAAPAIRAQTSDRR